MFATMKGTPPPPPSSSSRTRRGYLSSSSSNNSDNLGRHSLHSDRPSQRTSTSSWSSSKSTSRSHGNNLRSPTSESRSSSSSNASYWSSLGIGSFVGKPMAKAMDMVDYVGQALQQTVSPSTSGRGDGKHKTSKTNKTKNKSRLFPTNSWHGNSSNDTVTTHGDDDSSNDRQDSQPDLSWISSEDTISDHSGSSRRHGINMDSMHYSNGNDGDDDDDVYSINTDAQIEEFGIEQVLDEDYNIMARQSYAAQQQQQHHHHYHYDQQQHQDEEDYDDQQTGFQFTMSSQDVPTKTSKRKSRRRNGHRRKISTDSSSQASSTMPDDELFAFRLANPSDHSSITMEPGSQRSHRSNMSLTSDSTLDGLDFVDDWSLYSKSSHSGSQR